MYGLKVYLFGNFRALSDDGATEIKLTRTLQTLLAFLILKRNRIYTREHLAGLFWGDQTEEHARGRLNTAIWRLKNNLEAGNCSPAGYLISNQLGEFGFNWKSSYWLDHLAFEDQMTNFLSKPIQDIGHQDLVRVETALQLYTSDLLDEFHEDWALRERENMRLLFLKGMAHLMNYYTHQNLFEQSIACGQQILSIDPLREEIHRELIRIYLTSGQRPLAVNQYKICREVLMAELGIEPMQETQNLYDLVLVSSGTNPEHHGKEKSPTFYQIMRQFNEAITALNNAQAQFKQAIKMLEKL